MVTLFAHFLTLYDHFESELRRQKILKLLNTGVEVSIVIVPLLVGTKIKISTTQTFWRCWTIEFNLRLGLVDLIRCVWAFKLEVINFTLIPLQYSGSAIISPKLDEHKSLRAWQLEHGAPRSHFSFFFWQKWHDTGSWRRWRIGFWDLIEEVFSVSSIPSLRFMSFQLLVAIFKLQWGEVIRVAFVFMLTLKEILLVNSLAFRGDSGPLYCLTRFFQSLANQWHGEPNCSHQTSQDCQWKETRCCCQW